MTGSAIHFVDGHWLEGNPMIMGPMTHATWMSSVVFDGARAFEGVAPDVEQHCARLNVSARNFGLQPVLSVGEMLELIADGRGRFPRDAELYIRPMLWAERGQMTGFVPADPSSTRFCLSLYETPLPPPEGAAVCLSRFRRPTPESAPTLAKASCLYPNAGRAVAEAVERGFNNAVVLDGLGNVAELATANLWIGKDGAAHTPAINGTFLNGVTRQRVAELLSNAGTPVHERTLTWEEVLSADEVFSTGNFAKVLPITRVEDRDFQAGPIYRRARELYWEWAHSGAGG